MALTLTDLIEASLATGGVNYIDLVRIKINPTTFLYWSSANVPGSLTGESWDYSPRIVSMDPLPFIPGFKDSTISLKFENTDGLVAKKANQGVLWQGCEVAVCRLFPELEAPDNQIGTWDNPYWWGWISQAPTFEEVSTMKISAGFHELTRPALRRRDRTCSAILGSEHFPYNPLAGKGLPQNKVSGTATGGDSTTLTTGATLTEIQENWLCFVKTKKIIGRVVTASAGVITVENWIYGGDPDTVVIPANGDSWICGPVYTTYDGTQQTCMNMGMFGANSQQDEDVDLNTDTRRYFTGLTASGNAYLEPGVMIGNLANSLYSSVEGAGRDGEVIPVRFGEFMADLKILAWGLIAPQEGDGDRGAFIHVLGDVGEGRIYKFKDPEFLVKLDGRYSPDNIDSSTGAWDDSIIVGGCFIPDCDDSAAVTSGELTESQQMQAIGSREAYAVKKKILTDTYKDTPWKFNSADGSGNALGCLAWVRVRFEKEGYGGDTPLVKVPGTGIMTLKADDTWTETPTVIDAFYWFMRNHLWGAGLDEGKFNTTATTAASVLAAGNMASGTSQPRVATGVLVAGPNEIVTNPSIVLPPCCVMLPLGTIAEGESLEGKELTIVTGTDEYTFGTVLWRECPAKFTFWSASGGYKSPNVTTEGLFISLDENFDGEIPEAGDTFYLQIESTSSIEGNRKYAANGSLVKDCRVGEMAEDILKNCNGTYYQKAGKMIPIIRDAVDSDEINERRIFSDWGANRNVMAPNGKTTFTFTPANSRDIPTSVRVEYVDIDQRYAKRQVTIRNAFAEERLAAITGEDIRDRKSVTLSLCLTGSLEQAVRLGTLYLRENSFIREIPNYHPGEFSLKVPIHYAQDVVPVEDVYRISGRNFPDWCQFMRVTAKKDDYSKGVVTLTGMPYFDLMYNYTQSDFIIIPGPVVTDSSGSDPDVLVIETLTESGFRDLEGIRYIDLEGSITLPS